MIKRKWQRFDSIMSNAIVGSNLWGAVLAAVALMATGGALGALLTVWWLR